MESTLNKGGEYTDKGGEYTASVESALVSKCIVGHRYFSKYSVKL